MPSKDPVKLAEHHKRKRYRRKYHILSHYSNGTLACACCGEDHIEFLAIDHIEGGGTQHRKALGVGDRFYLWLMREDYPSGYRVLCHNCNSALGMFGYCPHASLDRAAETRAMLPYPQTGRPKTRVG
jgi:hypothetical protein